MLSLSIERDFKPKGIRSKRKERKPSSKMSRPAKVGDRVVVGKSQKGVVRFIGGEMRGRIYLNTNISLQEESRTRNEL